MRAEAKFTLIVPSVSRFDEPKVDDKSSQNGNRKTVSESMVGTLRAASDNWSKRTLHAASLLIFGEGDSQDCEWRENLHSKNRLAEFVAKQRDSLNWCVLSLLLVYRKGVL